MIKLSEQGAVLADGAGCWHAQAAPITRGSAVGAGDAFLASFLVADEDGAPPYEALRRAVAAGTAVLASNGTALLTSSTYHTMLKSVVVTPV